MVCDPTYVRDRTDEYFNKTTQICEAFGDARVTYAVFMRTDVVVAVDLALEALRSWYPEDAKYPLEIRRLHAEGALLAASRPIFYVTGSMAALSPLETLLLRNVGWACKAGRNAYEMCVALPKVTFLDMHARHATGDDMNIASAYGASVGSRTARMMQAVGFVGTSQAMTAPFFGETRGRGTMPHSLIGYAKARIMAGGADIATGNATLLAAQMYAETFPEETTYTVLVDYDGREITDALAVCRWFYDLSRLHERGKKLAFRLDTHGGRWCEGLDWEKSVRTLMEFTHLDSIGDVVKAAFQDIGVEDLESTSLSDLRDKYLFGTGVTAANVVWFRRRLNEAGYSQPTIVGSSGFDVLKCRTFGNLRVPVDVIGTGSFLPSRTSATQATADIVRYEVAGPDGKLVQGDIVKVGREYLKIAP